MKIFVLGGDGFCGWPTSLGLAAAGHEVVIIDNLSRRRIDEDLNSNSLTEIADIDERIKVANELVGKVSFENINIAEDYEALLGLIVEEKPDSIMVIDVRDAVELSQDLCALPAAGVVNQRQSQSPGRRDIEPQHDVRRVVGGCDDVDVVAAYSLQVQHHVGLGCVPLRTRGQFRIIRSGRSARPFHPSHSVQPLRHPDRAPRRIDRARDRAGLRPDAKRRA